MDRAPLKIVVGTGNKHKFEEIRAILEQWSNLVADWMACRYNEDGSLTEAYATELCDVNCGGGGSSGSSTTSS